MTNNAFLFRQVALVGYGTQFLRHKLPLEDWHRHGVFFDARFQFRSREDNRLLADDFTVWLGTLALAGATRLSLHPAAELSVDGAYAVAVHFADRYQVWAVGVEPPEWEERFEFPRARGYAGDIDSYWLTGEQPGQLPVPATDWKQLAAAIAADLDMNVPSSNVPTPAGPFFPYIPEEVAWARLPLFPSVPRAALAHRIVATLDWKQGRFSNDTNPKNEGNLYLGLDDEGAHQLQRWGQRLDAWLIDALLRSANEDGEIGLFRQIKPPSAPPPEHAAPASPTIAATAADPPAPLSPASKRGCLMTLAVLVLLAVVLTIQAWSRSS